MKHEYHSAFVPGIIIKGFYKHSISLRSYFNKVKTKLVANVLLFKVCHFNKL